jgi:competence ComEA-like helix-hairpin-helix protein
MRDAGGLGERRDRGGGDRPAGEGLAARIPGLVVALAGAGLLAWSLWSGSRPVEGLERGGVEWLVPESGAGEGGSARPGGDGAASAGTGLAAREGSAGAVETARAVARDASTEQGAGDAGRGAAEGGGADAEGGGALRIDINVANAAQFELLPDIGPTLARRIADDRAANGPFRAPEDLMRVRGIGPKTLEKIRGLIVCGGG